MGTNVLGLRRGGPADEEEYNGTVEAKPGRLSYTLKKAGGTQGEGRTNEYSRFLASRKKADSNLKTPRGGQKKAGSGFMGGARLFPGLVVFNFVETTRCPEIEASFSQKGTVPTLIVRL